MRKNKKKECLEDDPDCFNCPFPDCYATLQDINRQNAYEDNKAMKERNKAIVDLWNFGVSMSDIGRVYHMTPASIGYILKKERESGEYVRKP